MRTEIDPDRLGQTVLDLYTMKQGEVMSAVVHLGVRLGLFDSLAEADGVTSEELAAATGLHERWVREWLFAIAATGLAEHEGGRFALTPEAKATLCDADHPAAIGGVFGPPITREEIDRTVEAFRTGIGMTWDEHGADTCHFQAAMGAARQRSSLVSDVIDAVPGLSERLAAGARVVDVGCGAGVAAATLAEAFPASRVLGIDPSAFAIDTARVDHAPLDNLTFEVGTFDSLAASTAGDVDLLLTLDVIHDLPRPEAAVAAARACLADDGVWLVADIRANEGFEANRKIPVLPLMYGMSILYCMSSAMSEPGGAGLGTLGLTVPAFEKLVTAAGFGHMEVREFDSDPLNRYFEVRV